MGDTLSHFTPAENLGGIKALGLMPPAMLAKRAGIDPASITLRSTPVEFAIKGRSVRLNHQKPLLAGRRKADRFLDGHTLESWAAQLDTRIFLWRGQQGDAFARSLPSDMHRFDFDAATLYDLYRDHIWLSPINSGSAMRKPALRGDWIYVSANATRREFLHNRRTDEQRHFINDRVKEISLTCPIPPDMLKVLRK
ncbi:hypothetical protein [uncultured Sulfitobacter sp.]|uniref:DUF7002 family protein n=1 Tax=uncultured Sulfitobacter sp. TaxID=191468 RepID=UPI0026246D70|nr:hypothetical protein [uncultured Sulfitobacter sp.]